MGAHRRLAGYVIVDGTPYGPDDHLPERIAVRITNPAAWEPASPLAEPVAVSAPVPAAVAVPDLADAGRDVTAQPDSPGSAEPGSAEPATDGPDTPRPDAATPVTSEPVPPEESTGSRHSVTTPVAETHEDSAPGRTSPPPRSGKGSGIDAWRAYARAVHVPVPDGAERGDIITACEKSGHLPPQ